MNRFIKQLSVPWLLLYSSLLIFFGYHTIKAFSLGSYTIVSLAHNEQNLISLKLHVDKKSTRIFIEGTEYIKNSDNIIEATFPAPQHDTIELQLRNDLGIQHTAHLPYSFTSK